MDLRVDTQGFKLTDAIRDYALEKILPRIEKHLHGDDTAAHAWLRDLSAHTHVYSCEVVLSLRGRRRIHVDERATELYKAIDKAADHLDEALGRDIKKKRTLARHRGRTVKEKTRNQIF